MTTKNETLKTPAQYAIHFIMRMFWRGLWAKLMTVAMITLMLQLKERYLDGNWELHKMWHVIGWAAWFMICLIVRIGRMGNTEIEKL